MANLYIDKTNILDTIKNKVNEATPTKSSELINDVGYVIKGEPVNNANISDMSNSLTENSGVVASSYGPSSNISLTKGTASINIPSLTVNSKGLISLASNKVLKISTY